MTRQPYELTELNRGFVVAIQLEANAGEEERLAESLERLIEPTMSEPGVKLLLPYRSPTDPKSFFVYELYIDEFGMGRPPADQPFQGFRRRDASAPGSSRTHSFRAVCTRLTLGPDWSDLQRADQAYTALTPVDRRANWLRAKSMYLTTWIGCLADADVRLWPKADFRTWKWQVGF